MLALADEIDLAAVGRVLQAQPVPARLAPKPYSPAYLQYQTPPLVMEADAERLVNAALRRATPFRGMASLFTAPLGQMTGSVESSTKGLEGHVRLGLD